MSGTRLLFTLTSLLLLAVLFSGCGGRETTWTEALPSVERSPQPEELLAYPEDGRSVGVNPPGFTWTPHDDAKAYRLEIRKASDGSRVIVPEERLAATSCALRRPLDASEYAWQVVYLGSDGEPFGVSKTRRFTVAPGLPELPMPDVGELKTKLVGVRPRIYLTGDRLKEIREAVAAGKVASWKYFLEAADGALEEESYPEPEGYPSGKSTVQDHRRILAVGKVASAHLARTALAYKITGEKKYLEGARRWMMTLASWDPKGIVSHDVPQPDGTQGADGASMPVLERMSYAWDWIGDELTPDERAKVLAVIPERGDQILRLLHKQDFLSVPFENHEGRALAFLGIAGLSFLGDIPEAEVWLDYMIRCFLTSYPCWGSDEGGWAQGVSYWAGYVTRLINFVEALRGATDVDLMRRPFFLNTGYFALYFHPPYAALGAFGDGGERGPNQTERVLIDFLAEATKDPILKWHAESLEPVAFVRSGYARGAVDKWRANVIEDAVSVRRARPEDTLASRPPTDLDGSRFHSNIGWAAMHSALGDADNDVWVLFKSSRFGSYSHSHGDQNTFQLNAYGEALAIDSGYYPWYGSPHHKLWTRQTRAHNGILVNGRGQPPFNWAAAGDIESFERRGLVTLLRGQAAEAYNVPMRESIVRQWRQLLREPVPPMEPKVESFERTLAFVASKSRPVLLLYDYLRTDGPTTFGWLLHALKRMQADTKSGAITIRSGKARLAVQLVATQPFQFSQFGGFPVPPEERSARSPAQWHLKAHTRSPATEAKFLAVMVPYRASERAPEIKPLESAGTVGFRVAGVEAAAWWGSAEKGSIRIGDLTGEGRMVLKVDEAGTEQKLVFP